MTGDNWLLDELGRKKTWLDLFTLPFDLLAVLIGCLIFIGMVVDTLLPERYHDRAGVALVQSRTIIGYDRTTKVATIVVE